MSRKQLEARKQRKRRQRQQREERERRERAPPKWCYVLRDPKTSHVVDQRLGEKFKRQETFKINEEFQAFMGMVSDYWLSVRTVENEPPFRFPYRVELLNNKGEVLGIKPCPVDPKELVTPDVVPDKLKEFLKAGETYAPKEHMGDLTLVHATRWTRRDIDLLIWEDRL